VDAAGNLFIADSGNDRIRRVSPDGIITTVAGDGSFGPSGDGGLATSAQLGMSWPSLGPPASPPNFVAVDGAGNLFIADYGRVRKVSPDGIINTVAENVSGPLAADGAGNLFVASNNIVVTVAPDETMTTVAGGGPVSGNTLGWTGVSGSACMDDLSGDGGQATQTGLCALTGIAVDGADNLLVGEDWYYGPGADNWAFVVRKVSPDGIITTVAGNTHEQAIDGGPATAGLIDWGGAVAVDGAGNLFITDDEDIRKISPDGIINTVAGRSVCAQGDSACAQGDLAWNAQQHFSGDGGPATSAILNQPAGVAVDGTGNLYIVDRLNGRVRKVTLDGIITTVAGGGTMPGSSADGGPATSANLSPGSVLAVDGAGSLFLTDGDRIRRVSTDGIITTVAGGGTLEAASADGGPATNAKLSGMGGLATDGGGNLYIAETNTNRVRKVTPDGIISTFAGTGTKGNSGDGGLATRAQLAYPVGVAVDDAVDVFIAVGYGVGYGSQIREVTPDGFIYTVAGKGEPGFSGDDGPPASAAINMNAIAVDGMGDLFIAEAGTPGIREITTDGIINTIAGIGTCSFTDFTLGNCFGYSGDGGPATDGRFSMTSSVAVDRAGNVYVADTYNNVVRTLRPVQ